MISHISGKCIDKTEKSLVLDVGGVGYLVFATNEAISGATLGENISLWTHLSVKENALELFGFKGKDELELFGLLISISGVGPRGALSVMNVANVEVLIKAISTGDTSYLTKVSGIGKKTAEKIVLELRDKVASGMGDLGGPSLSEEMDAVLALQALGYGEREAREALKKISPDVKDTKDKVKEALKILNS